MRGPVEVVLLSPTVSHVKGEDFSLAEGVDFAAPPTLLVSAWDAPADESRGEVGDRFAPSLTKGASAWATSIGVGYRCAGSLASIFATTAANASGTSGRAWFNGLTCTDW